MGPALRDLQAAFAAHLAGEARDDLLALVGGDLIPPAARLQVHRNHVRQSLAAALAATFPTVQAVVGEAFFLSMVRAFVADGPPAQPVLAEYGQTFPPFVAGWDAARDLPYLADVARLDWALNVAWNARADLRLAAADLAGMPAERLPLLRPGLSAGTCVLASAYPLDRIWQASQPGAEGGTVALGEAVSLVVLRAADDAWFVRLSPGEAAFLEAVGQDQSLEAAATRAEAAQRDFDLSSAFSRLLALGCFAALQQ